MTGVTERAPHSFELGGGVKHGDPLAVSFFSRSKLSSDTEDQKSGVCATGIAYSPPVLSSRLFSAQTTSV
jgi:hypothetical protein